jgi:hypothetical protein
MEIFCRIRIKGWLQEATEPSGRSIHLLWLEHLHQSVAYIDMRLIASDFRANGSQSLLTNQHRVRSTGRIHAGNLPTGHGIYTLRVAD